MSKCYIPQSAMAIFAHPDDIEFTCAGTMARWANSGTRVSYILLTSGDAGINDPEIAKDEAITIRESEARTAAKICGVEEIRFLGESDGILEATISLRKKIVQEIRRFKPEVIMCGDPTVTLAGESYINHPDHRAAALAAIDAVFPAAGQANLFNEIFTDYGYTAHKPRKVYIQTWQDANTFVNIENTIELKVKALRTHKSQLNGWDPEDMIKEWAKDTAKGKEMAYAEGFKMITLVNDEDWELCQGDPVKLFYAQKDKNAEK